MIYVLATIEIVPGGRAKFLEEFHKIVSTVRAEHGCHEYAPAVDVETDISAQGTPRPDIVMVLEKWASLEALEAHLMAPHMMDYRQRVKTLVTGTHLQILEPA